MSANRDLFRQEARKVYKKNTKGVPKNRRITFAEFFKQYKKNKAANKETDVPEITEDFDFGEMVSVNKVEEPVVEAKVEVIEKIEEDK